MLKKFFALSIIALSLGFVSCEKKEAAKEKPFLISADFGDTGGAYLEWDGVEGAQHTLSFVPDSTVINRDVYPGKIEHYEFGFSPYYKGYEDVSIYTTKALQIPVYDVTVISHFPDGEKIVGNTIRIVNPTAAGLFNFE
jgi:hypothetical protein